MWNYQDKLAIETAESSGNDELTPYRTFLAAAVERAYEDATSAAMSGKKHQLSALLWMFGSQAAPTSFEHVMLELQAIDADAIRIKVKRALGESRLIALVRQLLDSNRLGSKEQEALLNRFNLDGQLQTELAL